MAQEQEANALMTAAARAAEQLGLQQAEVEKAAEAIRLEAAAAAERAAVAEKEAAEAKETVAAMHGLSFTHMRLFYELLHPCGQEQTEDDAEQYRSARAESHKNSRRQSK